MLRAAGREADVLGFSLGGLVAQELAPELARAQAVDIEWPTSEAAPSPRAVAVAAEKPAGSLVTGRAPIWLGGVPSACAAWMGALRRQGARAGGRASEQGGRAVGSKTVPGILFEQPRGLNHFFGGHGWGSADPSWAFDSPCPRSPCSDPP